MFQVLVIKPNRFDDFPTSLWKEKEKVKEYVTSVDTSDLKQTLNTIFNPDGAKEKLDLNTSDVLFIKDHTYQIVYDLDSVDENYVGTVISYKRKAIKGLVY